MDWKIDSRMDWLNFIEKRNLTILDLFCICKSDNNTNITYINHLQLCPRSLVRNILLCPVLKISSFVCTSHPLWRSRPSIITAQIIHGRSKARLKTGYDIVLAKLRDHCCKQLIQAYRLLQQRSRRLTRIISYPVFNLALDPSCINPVAAEQQLSQTISAQMKTRV